ncbi:MAG: extracellular solute-binding protein [Oligoflexia bacterium]|nr:extracellular solute-binding protein [Oligoflexia bacterium]
MKFFTLLITLSTLFSFATTIVTTTMAATTTHTSQDKVVYFYNWTEYLPDDVIKDFEKETGIKVIYSTYDNNEAMYAKIKMQKENPYDIVVPSGYFVKKMVEAKLLQKIDQKKLNNFKNLDPDLLNKSFDPKNQYTIPYFWGSTVIAVNKTKIDPNQIKSFKDLWKKEFKNKVLLLNDMREVFFISLKTLKLNGNTKNESEIKKAYENLLQLKPNIKAFDSDSPKTAFLAGEVAIGAIWNGEIFQAMKENRDISYIIPKEGAFFYLDNLAIPYNARNVENAYKLINFILRADIAKRIAMAVGYASPNLAARKLLPKEIANNPLIYPEKNLVKSGDFQDDVGDALQIYQRYFEKLKL